MSEITVVHDGRTHRTESFAFPGGELQVRLPGVNRLHGDVLVHARLQDAASILRLVLAAELLGRLHRRGTRTLLVPYFPYARQDRVMQPGEAFSLKAVARIINGLGFDRVVVCDPHSDVTAALLDRVEVVSQLDLIRAHDALVVPFGQPGAAIVAPDAGAVKKASTVARHFARPLVVATKVRDAATGEITGTEVYGDAIGGGRLLIVDDICDGGRTFVELAKALRAAGAAEVHLYVTHGIFSRGLGVFDGLIDGIYTTDSFASPHLGDARPVPLHVLTLNYDARGLIL